MKAQRKGGEKRSPLAMTDLQNLLPANVLIDLYARLRNELGDKRRTLDPNDKLRVRIAMPC
jgi:hypothetical protein